MKSFRAITAAFAGAVLLASTASAQADTITPIVIKGQHFFHQNGTEFFIRGVAYQRGVDTSTVAGATAVAGQYDDPLTDGSSCSRDIPYLKRLRTNTVRVYNIDPSQNHDDCMNQLAAAGIYVVADLSQPMQSINRNDPTWDDDLYIRYISVIDVMAKYQNMLGFFAGNEVSNSPNTTEASAYVKAAVRDTKAYIKNQGYRPMGVGYATYDGPIRDQLADYFVCGPREEGIDFWGYNVYSWCGDSNYDLSGYDERTNFFRNYGVPAFFAEYGCNKPSPRTFTEVPVLFGPKMSGVWSGGIVYMYFQEVNDYGLVQVNGNSVTPLQDFDNLSSQMAKVTPASTSMAAYNAATPTASCPPLNSNWAATSSPLPPTPNRQLCQCMVANLKCAAVSNNANAYGKTFKYICGKNPRFCAGINHNGTTGEYGAYSGCNPKEQLSFVMNQYYNAQDPSVQSQACDFGGLASTQTPSSPDGSCSSLLQQAGSNGQGTVAQPTGNAAAQGGTTGSGSSMAAGFSIPSVLYLVITLMSGAGMLLL